MTIEKATSCIKQFEKMVEDRSTFDGILREMAYFAKPAESSLVGTGNKTTYSPYQIPQTPVAIKATKTLANGIYSNSVPAGTKWFNMASSHPSKAKSASAKTHYAKARDVITRQLQMSNFALETGELLQRYCALGTDCMYPKYDRKKQKFVFKSHSITDVYIAENEERMPDTLGRVFMFTAKQAYQKWGDENHETVVTHAMDENKMGMEFEFIHMVKPRLNRDENKLDSKNMEWESVYVDKKHKHVVHEGGFKEFPFQAPRFYLQDKMPYGLPPTYDALSDLRILDRATIDFVDAVELSMRPPIFTSDMETVEDAEIEAGAINYIREGSQFHQMAFQGRIDIGNEFLHSKEESIKQMFFVNLFLSQDQQAYRTATEVSKADTEKFQSIASFTQRLQIEYFGPLIKRVYNICVEEGLIEVPEDLQGEDINITYVNNIDALLNQNEVASFINALQQAGQVEQTLQALPSVKAKVKAEDAIDYILEANNVSPELIRTEAEYKKFKEAELKAQQQASQEQMMMEKMGQVDPNKKPEEGSIVSEMGGQF